MTQTHDAWSDAKLAPALVRYAGAVDGLKGHARAVLDALLARDEVEAACRAAAVGPDQVRLIADLDRQVEDWAGSADLSELARWRSVVQPPENAAWWFLDRQVQQRQESSDLPWVVLTGICMLVTTTLAIEIIRRLWTGAPDLYAIFGTLLALLLTASPLSSRGGELAAWALRRVRFIHIAHRRQAMAGAAFLALVLVLAFWLVGLPLLALQYNNRGVTALEQHDVAAAQHAFGHAAAMNPDQVAAYHNLAVAYYSMGRLNDALEWYQKATALDRSFAPSYEGLSRLYNEQAKTDMAERTALAGLQFLADMRARPGLDVSETAGLTSFDAIAQRQVTRYRLLSDLGQAYHAEEKYGLSQQALEEAVAMEPELRTLEQRLGGQPLEALPHFYLAQIYAQQGNVQGARTQWEDALRYLKKDNWADREWFTIAQQGLAQALEGGQK